MKIQYSKLLLSIAISGIAGCAQLQTAQTKATAFSNTPSAKLALSAVTVAAKVFAPEYAGVLQEAIYSLQTGKLPALTDIASTVASFTGSNPTEAKVLNVTTAILAAAQSAPTPTAGLTAAAQAVPQ